MIYAIKIDGDIDERLKEFNAKLPVSEKITQLATTTTHIFITTEKKEVTRDKWPNNLLLDSIQKRSDK